MGSADCGRMGGAEFKVKWSTDCAKQMITFTLQVRAFAYIYRLQDPPISATAQTNNWGDAWVGIGLHDAGTVASPKPFPSTAMNGLDIVQVAPPWRHSHDKIIIGIGP